MQTFVMGDLHGNYDALRQCLKRAAFNYEQDTLIQLGDIVDGEEFSFECVEELLKIKHLVSIKGNHDAWLQEYIKTGYHPVKWGFGALNTARSYAKHAGKKLIVRGSPQGYKVSLNPADIPEMHQLFFKRQSLYYIDKWRNCFVHAGFDTKQPFNSQRPENYYWDRLLWQNALKWQIAQKYQQNPDPFDTMEQFNAIFLGHTSTLHWHITVPMKAANIYNIDTGSGGLGKLTIMNVQTLKFWQSGVPQ